MEIRCGRGLTRRISAGVCALLLGFQTGCYTFLPVQTEVPPTSDRIAVILNDRGRFQMADVLGPMVDVVEGSVARQDPSSVRLLVYRVKDLRGGVSTWTGETIDIPREGITGFRERKLSKARSWVLAGTLVGAVVISALLLDLNLFGDPQGDAPCTGPACGTNPSIRR